MEVVLIIAACLVIYWISVKLGPGKKCVRCKGSGSIPGFLGGLKSCPSCGGKGMIKRLGAK